MMNDPIRVLIADDHPIVRQGLEVMINAQPDMVLTGQATNGAEAIEMALALSPDVVVMDLKMPVKDGLTAMEEIESAGIDVRIVVLTSFPDDDMVIQAVKAGAAGILLKDSPPEHLLDAIRTVHRDESALHPTVAHKLMQAFRQLTVTPQDIDPLTPREIDVLKCLARGYTNREIALELEVSVRTVTTHVRNILDKLNLENRTQAALYAVEHGIDPIPDQ